jgi:hypothetical protein
MLPLFSVATELVITSVCVPFPADLITPSSRSARAVCHSLTRRSNLFTWPVDLKLLSGARRSTERVIDDFCKPRAALKFGALARRASACGRSVFWFRTDFYFCIGSDGVPTLNYKLSHKRSRGMRQHASTTARLLIRGPMFFSKPCMPALAGPRPMAGFQIAARSPGQRPGKDYP